MSKKLILLVSFLVLLATSSAMVLYGILTTDDPGLANPDARWKKASFPLLVDTSAYTPGADAHKHAVQATKGAIDQTNTRLGFTAYKLANDEVEVEIAITIGVPKTVRVDSTAPVTSSFTSAREAGGSFELRGMGGFWDACTIETSNAGTDALLSLVLQHELGHCLDLAHDESRLSIMRDEQTL